MLIILYSWYADCVTLIQHGYLHTMNCDKDMYHDRLQYVWDLVHYYIK